jgi:hypothetical protein
MELGRDEPGMVIRGPKPGSFFDLIGTVVGAGRADDLAIGDQLAQGLECFVDRGFGVGAVLVVDIDVVGAEPAQADVASFENPAAESSRLIGFVCRTGSEFGGHYRLVPSAAESPAQEHLGVPTSVALCSIEVIDPGIEGGADHSCSLTFIDPHAEVVAT